MDEKKQIKGTTDELKDVKSDDSLQFEVSNDNPPVEPNPPVEEKSEMDKKEDGTDESKLKEDDTDGLRLKDPGPDGSKLKEDDTDESKLKDAGPDGSRLKLIQRNASVDSSETEDTVSKTESPKTSSNPSIKGSWTNQKSSESLEQPSTSGQDRTIASGSSLETEENFSEPGEEDPVNVVPPAENDNKEKAIQNAQDSSDLGSSLPMSDPPTTENSAVINTGSSLTSFPTSGSVKTSPSETTGGSLVTPDSNQTPSSEARYDPKVLSGANSPQPGQVQQQLPADAVEMSKINKRPPVAPPPPPTKEDGNRPPAPSGPSSTPRVYQFTVIHRRTRVNYLSLGKLAYIVFWAFVILCSPVICLLLVALLPKTVTVTNATYPNETYYNASYTNQTFGNASYTNETIRLMTSGLNDFLLRNLTPVL